LMTPGHPRARPSARAPSDWGRCLCVSAKSDGSQLRTSSRRNRKRKRRSPRPTRWPSIDSPSPRLRPVPNPNLHPPRRRPRAVRRPSPPRPLRPPGPRASTPSPAPPENSAAHKSVGWWASCPCVRTWRRGMDRPVRHPALPVGGRARRPVPRRAHPGRRLQPAALRRHLLLIPARPAVGRNLGAVLLPPAEEGAGASLCPGPSFPPPKSVEPVDSA